MWLVNDRPWFEHRKRFVYHSHFGYWWLWAVAITNFQKPLVGWFWVVNYKYASLCFMGCQSVHNNEVYFLSCFYHVFIVAIRNNSASVDVFRTFQHRALTFFFIFIHIQRIINLASSIQSLNQQELWIKVLPCKTFTLHRLKNFIFGNYFQKYSVRYSQPNDIDFITLIMFQVLGRNL